MIVDELVPHQIMLYTWGRALGVDCRGYLFSRLEKSNVSSLSGTYKAVQKGLRLSKKCIAMAVVSLAPKCQKNALLAKR